VRLLIGLGGNQGAAYGAFSAAVAALAARVEVLSRSAVWRSEAHGPPQPDYLNAAVLVETGAHPSEVLALCRCIEADAGRDRTRELRWGPRPLDLDLLMAPGLVIETPALTLPHPRLAERLFALVPAAELAPDWVHPRLHRTLAALAGAPALAAQRCERSGTLGSGA
jgi:2-amino-4-hydroxy-6-hydroxymethyldihydropteridine diphosphokinase